MNSKMYESIPEELNIKLKNAKLNNQKNDLKFTTLLTPFSDSIFFDIFSILIIVFLFQEYRFYSLLLAIFLFVSVNLIGFQIYDFLVSKIDRIYLILFISLFSNRYYLILFNDVDMSHRHLYYFANLLLFPL